MTCNMKLSNYNPNNSDSYSEASRRQERNDDFADGDLNFSDSASASEQVRYLFS